MFGTFATVGSCCRAKLKAVVPYSRQNSQLINFGAKRYHQSAFRHKEAQGSWKPGMPGQPRPGEPPVPVGKNLVVGGFIACFVGGVYGYTVFQMRKQAQDDFLDDIETGPSK